MRNQEALRQLPAVDALVQAVLATNAFADLPRELVVAIAREEIDGLRRELQKDTVGAQPAASRRMTTIDALTARVQTRLHGLSQPSLRPVINASGVIIQTNLGRAPLSAAALAAMAAIGGGYSNLEYDLVVGERGSRYTHLEQLLCRLTGAEAAMAVNNNAAAIYLALISLAAGREVIVSRGQAVEIGGGFRIPDVLRASGATLVEVGTTNRTYARDYAAAINERTALLLRVHSSNFRLVGFVHETPLAELVQVGQQHGVAVLDDLGSGTLLDTKPYGLAAEPTVQESVAAGADLITFSGDKLLGGPQAGLLVGRKALVEQLKRHPLARAMRCDKTTIAGLEATLHAYLRGTALRDIPVWRMIGASLGELQRRAEQICAALVGRWGTGVVVECQSAIGGGSLPGETLPSKGVALSLRQRQLEQIASALRVGQPAVVARIADGQLIFDLRTVDPAHDQQLITAIQTALQQQAEEHA
jgi:L-seryl-tRNA(Ser) seleniumtransferase